MARLHRPGQSLLDQELYHESLAQFQEILRLAPGDPMALGEAYSHISAVLLEMGRPKSEVENWLTQQAQATSDPLVRESLGRTLLWIQPGRPPLEET